MTSPTIAPAELAGVEVDLDAEASCTLRRVQTGIECTRPAVWAVRFRCCGYVKLFCEHHYDEVRTEECTLTCRGCGHWWEMAEMSQYVHTAWRI